MFIPVSQMTTQKLNNLCKASVQAHFCGALTDELQDIKVEFQINNNILFVIVAV